MSYKKVNIQIAKNIVSKQIAGEYVSVFDMRKVLCLLHFLENAEEELIEQPKDYVEKIGLTD